MILLGQIEALLERYNLLNNEKKVIIAVSGGVDSIVLLHLMQSIASHKRPKLIVAHINHELRPESVKEEKFVRTLSKQYDVSFYSYTWEKSKHPKSGIEEAARTVRYRFLKELMDKENADVVMTAHHQDDQVETILMKLTRGSTLEQMTGIKSEQSFHKGRLIRPLLSFSKESIYRYAESEALNYMEDQSNHSLDYTRNRFRNRIIPLLKEENPQFNQHMTQFKLDLEDLLAIASSTIHQEFDEFVTVKDSQIAFHQEVFQDLTKPMQRAMIHQLLQLIYEGLDHSYKANYIELIQDWLSRAEGHSSLQLAGGVMIEKSYDRIMIHRSTDTLASVTDSVTYTLLDNPNQKLSLSHTETIELQVATQDELATLAMDHPYCLVFDTDQVEFPLTIRHRLPGDRMTYTGLVGSKKIKDIFIDAKTPLEERDKAWIVEDATGQIIWLIPYRKMYLLSQSETDKLTYILKYND